MIPGPVSDRFHHVAGTGMGSTGTVKTPDGTSAASAARTFGTVMPPQGGPGRAHPSGALRSLGSSGVLRDAANSVDEPADAKAVHTPPSRARSGNWRSSAEGFAIMRGQATGTGQAAFGWAKDIVAGAAVVGETAFELFVKELERETGWIPDGFAAKQSADVQRRIDGWKSAAQQILNDPEAVLKAFAESYAARFELGNDLERAYLSGAGDLSLLREAARIRSQARGELLILGAESLTSVVAVGGLVKGLRTAKFADKLNNATPLELALATKEQAQAGSRALEELVSGATPDRPVGIEAFKKLSYHELWHDGREFDRLNAPRYDANEVLVDSGVGKSGRTRLDSYNFKNGINEIVSRKNCQLSEILPSTAKRYMAELQTKYAVDTLISDTPKNRAAGLDSRRLRGQYILEVPVQAKTVPESIITLSRSYGVIIRDVDGRIYN